MLPSRMQCANGVGSMSEFEQSSKAVIEVAKAGGKISDAVGKAVDAGAEIGRFLSGSSLKEIPRAIVSLLGGDWIIGKQVENIIKIQTRIHEIAHENNVRLDPESLPWRIKVETIRGIADEDNEFLQEKWSNLLVLAMRDDDKRKELDRITLDIMKRLTPQSARLLVHIFYLRTDRDSGEKRLRSSTVRSFSEVEGIPVSDAAIVMDYLTQLRCVQHFPISKKEHFTSVTALGREMAQRLGANSS